MPWRCIKSLEKALLASSCAAACDGPKHGMPAASMASTRPSTRGCSGPTATSATPFCRANATMPDTLSPPSAIFALLILPPASAVPPLPGETSTRPTCEDLARDSAMACSRPPEPITSTVLSENEASLTDNFSSRCEIADRHLDASLSGSGGEEEEEEESKPPLTKVAKSVLSTNTSGAGKDDALSAPAALSAQVRTRL